MKNEHTSVCLTKRTHHSDSSSKAPHRKYRREGTYQHERKYRSHDGKNIEGTIWPKAKGTTTNIISKAKYRRGLNHPRLPRYPWWYNPKSSKLVVRPPTTNLHGRTFAFCKLFGEGFSNRGTGKKWATGPQHDYISLCTFCKVGARS